MTPDIEFIADRRRLRRRLTLWRVLAVSALLVAIVVVGLRTVGDGVGGFVEGRRHIARVSIDGFIANDRRIPELLERIEKSQSTSGVILAIDSPGGTTTGAEELYRAIRRLAEKKPTVTFINGTAASGGYIAAIGADRIVARQTSLVGSIGVLFQIPNVSELLDTIGVRMEEIKSTPLKATPSPLTPTSPEARAAMQNVVDDTYLWFKELVAARRPLTLEEMTIISDGRVHNGRQALALKLVDQIGSERDAVHWLEVEREVPRDLPIRDWRPRSDGDRFGFFAAAFAADLLGFDRLSLAIRRATGQAWTLQLDGLLSLWQPHAEK